MDFPDAGDVFSQFTAVFLDCHLLYFYFAIHKGVVHVKIFELLWTNIKLFSAVLLAFILGQILLSYGADYT